MPQMSTQRELRSLLRACRQLMREILTVSHEERGEEWLSFLSAATRQVEEATRCVQDFDQRDSSSGEVERLANNLARLYIQDMLAREERHYASATVDATQAREGFREVKIYNRLTVAAYDALLGEARERGMRVTGHVPDAVGIDRALGRQDCIEHLDGYFHLFVRWEETVARELARRTAASQARWSPSSKRGKSRASDASAPAASFSPRPSPKTSLPPPWSTLAARTTSRTISSRSCSALAWRLCMLSRASRPSGEAGTP